MIHSRADIQKCLKFLAFLGLVLFGPNSLAWAQKASKTVLVPDVATSEFTLANGLKVVLRRDQSVPRVNVILCALL
ncbi:MAG: hypothetical protein NT172_07840 [Planctomycetota bacterium]|nr:hypothetical protein [Planctomycetota bacterium]